MPSTFFPPLYYTQYLKDLIKREKLEHQRKEMANIAAIIYAGMGDDLQQKDGIVRAILIAKSIIQASEDFGKEL